MGPIVGSWISASEAGEFLKADGLRYAAVKSDGTQVTGVLQTTSSGWTKQVPSNPMVKPGTRTEFGTAVSATMNRIFVIGGVDGGGTLRQDVWSFNPSTGVWSNLALGGTVRPARVLAAAYAPDEGNLVVLDKAISSSTVTYRLLRIPATGGSPVVVGSWVRTTTAPTTFALAVEPWATGYVVACGTSTDHRLLVLSSNGSPTTVTLTRTTQAAGTLANRNIRVGHHGITLVTPDGDSIPRPIGYRMGDLSTVGGSTGLCF